MKDLFSLDAYDYELPQELIAQYPIEPRDHARLLIVNRKSGRIEEARVYELASLLQSGDGLIFNNTRVLHARLYGHLISGKRVEILLIKSIEPTVWQVLAKPARDLSPGTVVQFSEAVQGTVQAISESGGRIMQFSQEITPELLQGIGTVPLPPYIRREPNIDIDAERYQTVYGSEYGSVAAPTAGLHFTHDLFNKLHDAGIAQHMVTLHVGTGTFLPIRTEDVREHHMHTELVEVTKESAQALNAISGRRIAVGTTSCRVLESVAQTCGTIFPQNKETDLFIYPGYQFKYIDALFTNFHTPRSSLLVLVAALMGYELMQEAYRKAIEKKFRFFSYGDAMLIL